MQKTAALVSFAAALILLRYNKKPEAAAAAALGLVLFYFAKPKCQVLPEHEKFIEKMHPQAQARFRCFLSDVYKLGYEVRVWSAWRGWPDSLRIWQTNAAVQRCCRPGHDYHFFGLAIDITLKDPKTGKQIRMASPRAEWEATGIGAVAKKHGLRWGIDFRNYYDPVHFDWPVFPVSKLVELHKEQFGELEKNKGNVIKF